jgi:hypothetical protein
MSRRRKIVVVLGGGLVALSLAGGMAVAGTTPVVTRPITLCLNNLVGTVRVSSTGTCGTGQSAVRVASAADATALAARVNDVQTDVASQNSAIAALQQQIGSLNSALSAQGGQLTSLSGDVARIKKLHGVIRTWGCCDAGPSALYAGDNIVGESWPVTGQLLLPGSAVTEHYLADGQRHHEELVIRVSADGSIATDGTVLCGYEDVYYTAVDVWGGAVETEHGYPSEPLPCFAPGS